MGGDVAHVSSAAVKEAANPGLRTGVPIHGALASVPGQQLPVENPGECRPLPPGPLRLLQEHEVVVRLAQARVLLVMRPAEEQLGAFP